MDSPSAKAAILIGGRLNVPKTTLAAQQQQTCGEMNTRRGKGTYEETSSETIGIIQVGEDGTELALCIHSSTSEDSTKQR